MSVHGAIRLGGIIGGARRRRPTSRTPSISGGRVGVKSEPAPEGAAMARRSLAPPVGPALPLAIVARRAAHFICV